VETTEIGASRPYIVWSPIGPALEREMEAKHRPLLMIVPFIQKGALGRLLDAAKDLSKLKVVTRWLPEDVAAGVSDIDIFPLLQKRGVPLYTNDTIHMKMYLFDSNMCLAGSANCTNRGLGYVDEGNLEAGCFCALQQEDWFQVYSVVSGSTRIGQDLYDAYVRYRDENRRQRPALPEFVPPSPMNRDFSISALPATESPDRLRDLQCGVVRAGNEEEVRKWAHDTSIYHLSGQQSPEDFEGSLKVAFRKHPFISRLVSMLKTEGSMRFGAVNSWIHQNCTDVPLPYRWKIKENTRVLYNWLAFFFEEISWDIPGQHSQVLYWRGGTSRL